MADIELIRRGLAANLRAALPANEGQVSPWLLDNPTGPCLQVAGFDSIDYLKDFGDGSTVFLVIEGSAGTAESRSSYLRFDTWLLAGEGSVRAAVEANPTLTSRWQDNGTIVTGQAAACDALQVTEFRGYRRVTLRNGAEVLLGDWVVQIETSG